MKKNLVSLIPLALAVLWAPSAWSSPTFCTLEQGAGPNVVKIADLGASSGIGDGEALNAGPTIENGDIAPSYQGAVSVVVSKVQTNSDGSKQLILRTEDSNLALAGLEPVLGNHSGVLSLDPNGKITQLSFKDQNDINSTVFSPCGSASDMQETASELANRPSVDLSDVKCVISISNPVCESRSSGSYPSDCDATFLAEDRNGKQIHRDAYEAIDWDQDNLADEIIPFEGYIRQGLIKKSSYLNRAKSRIAADIARLKAEPQCGQ